MSDEDSTDTIASSHSELPDENSSDDPDDQDQISNEDWNSSVRWEHGETAPGWSDKPHSHPDIQTGDITANRDVNFNITINGQQDTLIDKLTRYITSLIRDRILGIGVVLTILNILWTIIQSGII